MTAPILAEVTRRDGESGALLVESAHRGHLVVLASDGAVRAAAGDPRRATFIRSTAKPFQAGACLELLRLSGGSPTAAEIAVAWASHRGEPRHIRAVRQLLSRSGTAAAELTCPPDRPLADPTVGPDPIWHNCSGKHAMFALAAIHQGTPRELLLDPDGPLQRVVLGTVAEALGPILAVGVDGCGAPAVVVTLAQLAAGYLALLDHDRWAAVRNAGFAHPGHVGGEGRLESALLAEGVVAKPGAEGVFAAAWRGRDGAPNACAVKIVDGASRAASTVVWSLLVGLGVVSADIWTPPPPLGGGKPAGEIRTTAAVAEVVSGLARGV